MNIARLGRSCCILATVAALPVLAQQKTQRWEVGGLGGGSLYLNNSVTAPGGSGDVGFKPSFSGGGFLGYTDNGRLGGEIRYLFEKNDMKLSSGGTDVNFAAQSHSIEYDVLIHLSSRDAAVRPYVVVGGGVKGYFGTGAEHAFQPLSNLAILSHTRQWEPMASGGVGVKFAVGAHTEVRVEVRDNATPVPKDVILPYPGASIGGWLHNITPLVGISYSFQ